ncbi:MAG: 50S ribosomal protein L29 [Actinomycetota bacterium]|nr:50S ribosomal protein L29 [Actinomycetota bacterium]MDA8386846.1 50S ribosomal protein L29 [Actinomycetota bacterium]MDA8397687.1 50S ribosomal protein L29 [Actinomycetota bacterium]
MTKPSELRTLADAELAERIEELTKELFSLRFDLATSQVANTARVSALKRDVARLRTIQNERAKSAEGGQVAR